MNCDSVDVKPRHIDWSAARNDGDDAAGTWTSWEADTCAATKDDGEQCGALMVSGYACPECGNDDWYGEGPMMNSFYPLPDFEPDDIEQEARKLAHVPLCLVRLNGGPEGADEWGLALTGGGMDLSWEICAAYIAMGYYPPTHFCRNLPAFAGMTMNKEKRAVLKACREFTAKK